MPKHHSEMSGLFRSLQPDDSGIQAAEQAAAHDAEERWPLFKAISPGAPPATPALSDDDRARWRNQPPPDSAEQRGALSLPGLGHKLADGLARMSQRGAGTTLAAATLPPVPEKKRPPAPASAVSRAAPPAPVNSGKRLSPAPVASASPKTLTTAPGFFKAASSPAGGPPRETSIPADKGDSLAEIFGRLEGPKNNASTAKNKHSSFLSRLGRR